MRKENLVIVIQNTINGDSKPEFKIVSLKHAEEKLKLKINFSKGLKTYRLQSATFKSGIHAVVGDDLEFQLMENHFGSDTPLGVFDKTNVIHLNTILGMVKEGLV